MSSPVAPDADSSLRVSATTDPGKLAKSISMTVQERASKTVLVRAMGPHSVNQAVKGLIIARQMLAANNLDIDIVPAFESTSEASGSVTVVIFHVYLIPA